MKVLVLCDQLINFYLTYQRLYIRAIVLNLCVINKGNYLHVPTFFGLALFALVWKSYKFICRDEDGWIDIVAIFTQY